jgi:hypothetical protein
VSETFEALPEFEPGMKVDAGKLGLLSQRRSGRTPVYPWEEVAAKAKKDPGRWHWAATDIELSHAVKIRQGKKKAFRPPEDWLVRAKGPRGGRGNIFVAYVPSPAARRRALTAQEADDE